MHRMNGMSSLLQRASLTHRFASCGLSVQNLVGVEFCCECAATIARQASKRVAGSCHVRFSITP